jgi:hypothetical protein
VLDDAPEPLVLGLELRVLGLELREAGLRRRMNNELNFPPNFERLVLGCIDAIFASKYSLESS